MCIICNNDINNLSNKITIQVCINVKKIPKLKNVNWLEIIQCKNLVEIENSNELIVLIIIGCPSINYLPEFKNIKGLKLQCKNLKKLNPYPSLERLELHNESVTTIPEYPNLKTLYLNHVSTVELVGYPELIELNINNSSKIMSIPYYNKLYNLEIQNCPNLISIRSITNIINNKDIIKNYAIYNCRYIRNLFIKRNDDISNTILSQLGLDFKKKIILLENRIINRK